MVESVSRLSMVSVNGYPINTITCYVYLGMHLDLTLNFEMHFQKIYKKTAGRVNLLWHICSSSDTWMLLDGQSPANA